MTASGVVSRESSSCLCAGMLCVCLVLSYPTVTQQAEQVHSVVKHFGLAHCVGIGVGLGANVLARFAVSTI